MLFLYKKGKGSPYSITEHRVLQLIQVLGSQPAGGMSHKPGGRLSLLSARPAVTPATIKRVATNFAARWTESRWVWTVCLRLLPDSATAAILSRALVRLSPARQPLGYRATACVCICAAAWVLAGGGWAAHVCVYVLQREYWQVVGERRTCVYICCSVSTGRWWVSGRVTLLCSQRLSSTRTPLPTDSGSLLTSEIISLHRLWCTYLALHTHTPRQTTTPSPYHSCFLQAGCPSCRPTNSVKALKAFIAI